MKILRIIARLNVGGPARHVVWLTRFLANDEFDSRLIAGTVPDGEEDMSYFATEHGVEPIYISELSRELSLKDVVSLYKIFHEIRRYKPDIIHTHTAKAGTVGRVAAFIYKWMTLGTLVGRPNKVKVVHTFHGHVFHSYYGTLKTRVFLVIERVLAAVATDRIVVISSQQMNEIHTRFGVGRKSQFVVIPLGIELEALKSSSQKRDAARAIFGAKPAEIVVGFTGRLTVIKNISLLLRSAKECANEANFRFVIVGDGSLRSELEVLAETLGVTENIMFLGNREDVSELLPGFDIIALTSRNEGTPLSLIEAMAAGVPVISTAVGGVVDIVGGVIEQFKGFDQCERGIAVNEQTPEFFAKGLIFLAKNERLRESFSISGVEYTRSNYSVERLTSDISSLYRDMGKA